MPFTFSHPAAVIPMTYLPRRWVSLTGLVIGSMTPDFEYFLRMRVYSSYSHTWTGMLWFDLPLTIILAFLYHSIVRNKLIDNLPLILKNRLLVFKQFMWTRYFKSNFLVVLLSCIVGTMTHILWDGFTHQHGQYVEAISTLQQTFMIDGLGIPVYKALQHTSSLIGGLLVLYSFFQLPVDTSLSNKTEPLFYWISVTLIALTVVALRFFTGLGNNYIGNIIVTVITGGLIGLILTPTILRVRYNGR